MKIKQYFPGKLLLILFLTLIAVEVCAKEAAQQTTKSFLWEVKSETATAYILGSIHFANSGLYPLDQSIEDAFKNSSELVLELNPLSVDQQKMQAIVVEKGMYNNGDTIANHISPELYTRLERHLADNNLPLQGFMTMKPGMLGIALSTIQLMKLGYNPTEGIDVYFAQQATGNKTILELETMEEQLSVMFDMPDENLMLKYTLQDLENVEQLYASITNAWKSGNAEAMDRLLLEQFDKHPELKPVQKRLFDDRNVKMAAGIKDLLKADQTFFVVVGAGHLVGDSGIIRLLENEGFAVRQL